MDITSGCMPRQQANHQPSLSKHDIILEPVIAARAIIIHERPQRAAFGASIGLRTSFPLSSRRNCLVWDSPGDLSILVPGQRARSGLATAAFRTQKV